MRGFSASLTEMFCTGVFPMLCIGWLERFQPVEARVQGGPAAACTAPARPSPLPPSSARLRAAGRPEIPQDAHAVTPVFLRITEIRHAETPCFLRVSRM